MAANNHSQGRFTQDTETVNTTNSQQYAAHLAQMMYGNPQMLFERQHPVFFDQQHHQIAQMLYDYNQQSSRIRPATSLPFANNSHLLEKSVAVESSSSLASENSVMDATCSVPEQLPPQQQFEESSSTVGNTTKIPSCQVHQPSQGPEKFNLITSSSSITTENPYQHSRKNIPSTLTTSSLAYLQQQQERQLGNRQSNMSGSSLFPCYSQHQILYGGRPPVLTSSPMLGFQEQQQSQLWLAKEKQKLQSQLLCLEQQQLQSADNMMIITPQTTLESQQMHNSRYKSQFGVDTPAVINNLQQLSLVQSVDTGAACNPQFNVDNKKSLNSNEMPPAPTGFKTKDSETMEQLANILKRKANDNKENGKQFRRRGNFMNCRNNCPDCQNYCRQQCYRCHVIDNFL